MKAVLLVAVLALVPLTGVAGETQILDVKDLDEHGKTRLIMIPAEPRYGTDRAEFERVE